LTSLALIERAFAGPGDTQEEKLQKTTLVLISGIVMMLAPFWGLIYFSCGHPWSGAIPVGYAIISAATLALFYLTKRFVFYRSSQLFLTLVLPFALQWSLGGFAKASVVCLWAVLAPLGSLMFDSAGRSLYWMLGFGAFLVASAVMDLCDVGGAVPPLPRAVIVAFYSLNVGAVFALFHAALRYFVRQREIEQEKSDRLLLNVLPTKIADRLKRGESTIADHHQTATVLFADIVGFTKLSSGMHPAALVALLNDVFSAFDRLADKHGLEKIKTIGDAYMAVGGLPEARADHASAVAQMALDMKGVLAGATRGKGLDVRIGIHTGEVVAGVIGVRKFSYDLWGDTVNTASRMESHGAPGQIHVSEAAFVALGDRFVCEDRGVIEVKGKGAMRTYWLRGARPS
jgi:class 3 adenylate cyclase